MKLKVVITVPVNDDASIFCCFPPRRSHSKAFKLAAGVQGVESVKLVGNRDQIEVIGEIDAVDLATMLRKKVGFAEIVSVAEEKSKDKPSEKKCTQPIIWPYPRPEIFYVRDSYPESWCWPL